MRIDRTVNRTPVPWRNGLGVQYEITCDGSLPDDWTWRLSTADITQNVPFSSFPGVKREFCVADGNGVVLTINGVDHRCEPGSITTFRGDDDVFATLIDGPMRALNLMVRDGAEQRRMDIASVGDGEDLGLSVACVAIVGPAQVVAQSQIEELSVLDAMLDVNLTLNTGVIAIIR
jgi:environmental stress-induced protein Ves